MSNDTTAIQANFFQKIKSILPESISLVDELADLLQISNDSAYRRLRCETLLSINELALLCKHYKVAFEGDYNQDNNVTFEYKHIGNDKENIVLWIKSIHSYLIHIGSRPQNSILYAADDVPIWHHFNDRRLIQFKLFYWLKCIVGDKDFVNESYNAALIPDELIQIAEDLAHQYNLIHSAEIWTEDTLNSTIKQLEYFWESGFFDNQETALMLCDLLNNELDILFNKVQSGCKNADGEENFKFYLSDVMVGNNSILATVGANQIAFVSYNTFNFMTTTNAAFINETSNWLKNLIKKSTLISGVSEKQRNQFFNVLRFKVSQLRQGIVQLQ